jgi:hypothetical protein
VTAPDALLAPGLHTEGEDPTLDTAWSPYDPPEPQEADLRLVRVLSGH